MKQHLLICHGIMFLLGIATGVLLAYKAFDYVFGPSSLRHACNRVESNLRRPQLMMADDREEPRPLAASKPCGWQFVEYIPSFYELYWTENIERLQSEVCVLSNLQTGEIQEWMTTLANQSSLQAFNPHIFSQFTFQNECTGELTTDFIEPLAGLLRSPLYCLWGNDYLVSKEYLLVSWNVSKKTSSRAFYFDLGASLFNSGAGGASQAWFDEVYSARGVQWAGIFAWEAQPHDPAKVWCEVPPHLRPIYHWVNIPVRPEQGHPDNALEFIRQLALPEDFVVLKLDIDNTPVEEALVNQILDDPQLLGLIDEFYFEYHVNTQPMHHAWLTQNVPETLADSYRIFTTLRSKGIMAHSWV